MAMIELTIHSDYVKDWGAWEGVREIFQNAMDENDRGNQISVSHRGSTLRVSNLGSELTVRHLLVGFSDKREDKKMRGEKGEGLDLGLLALVRAGFDVQVQTPTENWVPVLEDSEKFAGEKVLFIKTRKVQQRRPGTTIIVKKFSKELWDQMKLRFLDFHEMSEDEKITVMFYGDLLLNPVYKGKIYVKGIYVQTDSEMKYGYNFHSVTLDRDRRMVDSFDLKYTAATILSGAMKKRPDLLVQSVWGMLNDEAKDVAGFGQYTDNETKKVMSDLFKETHGEDAVAVSNIGESEEMGSYGSRGVVAPKAIREIVADEVGTPEQIREKASKTVEKTYSWDELEDEEQMVLKKVANQIERALNTFRSNMTLCQALETHTLFAAEEFSVMGCMRVVEFVKGTTKGMYTPKTGEFEIARHCLKNYFLALRVTIHELSHKISGGGDTTVRHEHTVEELWTAATYVGNGDTDD